MEKKETFYNFKVSTDEANLIVGALGELPYSRSAGIIANLQEQYKSQYKEPEAEEVLQE
jgi:hypothetical protein